MRQTELKRWSLPAAALLLAGCGVNVGIDGLPGAIGVGGYSFDFRGEQATRNESGEFDGATTRVDVENLFGDVRIEPATGGPPKWSWELKCWADDLQTAESYTRLIEMQITETQDGVTWKLVLPEPPVDDLRGVRSNLVLSVPSQVEAHVQNRHGDTSLTGIAGPATLETGHGDSRLEQIEGTVTATHRHGAFTLQGSRDARLECQHGDVSLADISGDLKLKSAHGNVSLANVQGAIEIEAQHGDLQAHTLAGAVRIQSQHGDIAVRGVSAQVELTNQHGEISVRDVTGDAVLRNQHGKIEVRKVTGSLDVAGSFDAIDIEASGPKVTCRNEHGDTRLTLLGNTARRVEAETSFGLLEVHMPAGSAPVIEAGTEHGKVQSDFPVLATSSGADNFAQAPDEALQMTLKNEHGDIVIRRD